MPSIGLREITTIFWRPAPQRMRARGIRAKDVEFNVNDRAYEERKSLVRIASGLTANESPAQISPDKFFLPNQK